MWCGWRENYVLIRLPLYALLFLETSPVDLIGILLCSLPKSAAILSGINSAVFSLPFYCKHHESTLHKPTQNTVLLVLSAVSQLLRASPGQSLDQM